MVKWIIDFENSLKEQQLVNIDFKLKDKFVGREIPWK